MIQIKPFTLYYFVLRILAFSREGLNLHDLKNRILEERNTFGKDVKTGSLYGTLSKLKALGHIQTTVDIVLVGSDNEEPVKKYLITSKGHVHLRKAMEQVTEESDIVSDFPDMAPIPVAARGVSTRTHK